MTGDFIITDFSMTVVRIILKHALLLFLWTPTWNPMSNNHHQYHHCFSANEVIKLNCVMCIMYVSHITEYCVCDVSHYVLCATCVDICDIVPCVCDVSHCLICVTLQHRLSDCAGGGTHCRVM